MSHEHYPWVGRKDGKIHVLPKPDTLEAELQGFVEMDIVRVIGDRYRPEKDLPELRKLYRILKNNNTSRTHTRVALLNKAWEIAEPRTEK